MRLLFVTHYFHPEVGAAPTRILELAQALVREWTRSDGVNRLPELPGWCHRPGRLPWEAARLEHLRGLRIVRTAVYPAPNRGVARRLLNHTSFALSALACAVRAGVADVVIVETPPLFTAAAGVAIARLKRARCC